MCTRAPICTYILEYRPGPRMIATQKISVGAAIEFCDCGTPLSPKDSAPRSCANFPKKPTILSSIYTLKVSIAKQQLFWHFGFRSRRSQYTRFNETVPPLLTPRLSHRGGFGERQPFAPMVGKLNYLKSTLLSSCLKFTADELLYSRPRGRGFLFSCIGAITQYAGYQVYWGRCGSVQRQV